MRRTVLTVALAATLGLAASGAMAHPGPKLLTAGSAKEQTAMTPGMSYEDIDGVHVFRGKPAPAKAAPVKKIKQMNVEIEVVAPYCAWRRLRHLRTHGFYSGDPYPSMQYTQGFYSGR